MRERERGGGSKEGERERGEQGGETEMETERCVGGGREKRNAKIGKFLKEAQIIQT